MERCGKHPAALEGEWDPRRCPAAGGSDSASVLSCKVSFLCGARVRSRCSLWVRSNLRSSVISSSQRLLRHIPRALCCAEMCLLTRALWRVGLSPTGCSSMGDSSEGLQCSSLGTDCSGIRVGSGKVFWGWCTVVWFTFPSRAAAPSTANRGGEEGEELLSSWGGCGLSYCLPEEAAGGANCVSLR